MPDAGRTREPCVQRTVHFAHASNDRAAGTTGIPCAMGLRLIARSPRSAGLIASVALGFVTPGLMPASGHQDHTPSPSVTCALVSRADPAIASPTPRP